MCNMLFANHFHMFFLTNRLNGTNRALPFIKYGFHTKVGTIVVEIIMISKPNLVNDIGLLLSSPGFRTAGRFRQARHHSGLGGNEKTKGFNSYR